MPRDLKLNSLSRYAKLSPTMALEEYGSCEVPAGCGGVVLRWRDRDCGCRLPFHDFTPGQRRVFLDGNELRHGVTLFPLGEHVLAYELEDVLPNRIALLVAVADSNLQYPDVGPAAPDRSGPALLTTDDGSWRYTLSPPPQPAWWYPEFDDSLWNRMAAFMELALTGRHDDFWESQVAELQERGALPLGVPAGGGKLWVRKRFEFVRVKRGGDK